MQQYLIHSASPPAITLTRVPLSGYAGTLVGTFQTGFGYSAVQGFGVSQRSALRTFHTSSDPSITLTQTALDGTHNGAFQTGFGFWGLYGYEWETGTISKFLGTTLSFIGGSLQKLNSLFIVPLTATLVLAGAFLKSTARQIAAVLNPRSDWFGNPSTIQTIQALLSARLGFSGLQFKRGGPLEAATLNFSGFSPRPIKSKILTAALSFVGVFHRLITRLYAALLQFSGALNNGGRLLTSTLSFVGTQTRLHGKIFTPTLIFFGRITRSTSRIIPASLSFITRIFHSIPTFVTSLTGTLSFSGLFASGFKRFQSLTAALSFVGNLPKYTLHVLTAILKLGGAGNYSSSLTVNTGQVPSAQSDFPMLISLTDSRLRHTSFGGHVQNINGYDIRPWSNPGLSSALSYELEYYSPSAGIVVMSAKIPSISVGTITYLSYGDSTITTDGSSSATWSNNYVSRYSLKDGTTLSVADSVGNNNGTNSGATAAAGKINGGASFNGSSSAIDLGHPSSFNFGSGDYTFSAWIYPAQVTGSAREAVLGNDDSSVRAFEMHQTATNDGGGGGIAWLHSNTGGTFWWQRTPVSSFSANTWTHVAAVRSGSNILIYLNGVSQTLTPLISSTVGTANSTTIDMFIGKRPYSGNNDWWVGSLDDVRISSVGRSADWLTTEFNNQNNPAAFLTLGSEVGGVSDLLKQINKITAAALSFIGTWSVPGRTYLSSLVGSLSFIGNLPRSIGRLLSTALSFVGTFSSSIGGQFFQNLTAALSFTGAINKSISHGFTAALSFAGAISKSVRHGLAAALSFVGNLLLLREKVFAAVLSFVGAIHKQISHIISASLSFVGSITRKIFHGTTATLSFTASWMTGAGHLYSQAVSGSLSFIGALPRKVSKKLSSAASFIGSIIASFTGLIFQSFTANLFTSGRISTFFHPHLTQILLQGSLKFRTSISSGWTKFKAFLLVLSGRLDQLTNQLVNRVLGRASFENKVSSSALIEQTIDTSTTTLDFGSLPLPLSSLFIKNTDTFNLLILDSDPGFITNPQTVPAGQAVYLSPYYANPIYAKASGTIQIEMAAGSSVPNTGIPQRIFRPSLSFIGDLFQLFAVSRLFPSTLSFTGDLVTHFGNTYFITPASSLGLSGLLKTGTAEIFVQFDINWHDAGSLANGTDPIVIGTGDMINGPGGVSVYPNSGQWQFFSDSPPNNFVNVGSTSGILDTWVTLGMHFTTSGSTLIMTPLVGSTEYTGSAFDIGFNLINNLYFGGIFSAATTNFELDNLTIGSSGWGSNDIFSANFNDFSIVPPFDSIIGTGLDASGGTLSVINSSTDCYAVKAL